uniref:Uncharacterized protein n=1 Tax=Nicotiana tabacum TaxID=4097 RepID=A0A1S3Y337_TOBAC|nr:PREDICTED: uncharacterized protein LOC107771637 [Nicotiana tabacum]
MEYLSRQLKTLAQQSNFNFHPKSAKLKLIQLRFADDLLLFSRGDITFVKMLLMFSKLFNNFWTNSKIKQKLSIFWRVEQHEILAILGFSKGELPIRYLGVPLSSKRVSVMQCQPLLDKMIERIKSWTNRFLSYAGRAQLIKSVLFSIQVYWSQIFVLPEKVIKLIEANCKRFLWTGGIELSKKALLAWDKICMPRSAGGLNILDISVCNKAAMCKLLWNLCQKKDKRCVKWIHVYYGTNRNLIEDVPQQASWIKSQEILY